MSPIKVLHVIARMNIGGPAVEIATLMRTANSVEVEQMLVTGYCQSGEVEFVELTELLDSGSALRMDSLGRSVRPLDDLKTIVRLAKLVRRYRPDVVHTHTAKAGVLGRLAVILFSPTVQVVHTFHGHLLTGYFTPWKTRLWILIERMLSYRTSVLVAVGDSVRSDLLSAGIGRQQDFRVIKSGLRNGDVPDRTFAREALRIDSSMTVIAYVGRLTQIKRPDRLLEVIRHVSGLNDQVRFVIAGGGEQYEWFVTQCQTERLPVSVFGWLEDVSQIYSASDIVLLTSDNEGTPLTLIEAGLFGLPVVSTNVGSVAEIILEGETGLLTERNSEALSNALGRLISDSKLRARMGNSAREFVTEQFSLEQFVKSHLSMYQEIVLRK